MHRELREHLDDAVGVSDLVVVVFLDVRGFSDFAGMAESAEAALFLRSMYIQILDEFFPDASFFKPTGDGLMIIRHVDRDSLAEIMVDSISKSLDLVTGFSQIAEADPMVNFDVPNRLGVGIARGAATGLISGDRTLDYSGRPLNLAARLMDLARPAGVVVDGRAVKGIELDTQFESQFDKRTVYVKGIADSSPITAYTSRGVTINPMNLRPLVGEPHVQELETVSFRNFCEHGRFLYDLLRVPVDPDEIYLEFSYPAVTSTGRKQSGVSTFGQMKAASSSRTPDGWQVMFDYGSSVELLKRAGVKSTWQVTQALKYLVYPEPSDLRTMPEAPA